jgi:hypothetical protein
MRKMRLVGVPPEQEKDAEKWFKAWSQASQQARTTAQMGQTEVLRRDWRPICSYVANLERIADLLLDTDGAWVTIGKAFEPPRSAVGIFLGARPEPVNERRFANQMVLQYPWTWSAGVLAGLLGISLWTLTRRVKSLDRLR